MFIVANLYLFPQILQTVTFSSYIWWNGDIKLSDAFLVIMIFRILAEPMRQLPNFLGQFLAFMVSAKRIQDYLQTDEIDDKLVEQNL